MGSAYRYACVLFDHAIWLCVLYAFCACRNGCFYFCSGRILIDKRIYSLTGSPTRIHRITKRITRTGHLHQSLCRTFVHTNYCTCAWIKLPSASSGVQVIGRSIVKSDAVIIIIPRASCCPFAELRCGHGAFIARALIYVRSRSRIPVYGWNLKELRAWVFVPKSMVCLRKSRYECWDCSDCSPIVNLENRDLMRRQNVWERSLALSTQFWACIFFRKRFAWELHIQIMLSC